jgi:OmpA family
MALVAKMIGVVLACAGMPAHAGADCLVKLKFGNESAALTGPVQAVLHQLAFNHARARIEILGNADMVANEPGNQALAVARAASVRAYLVGRGLAEARITIAPAPDDLLQLAGIAPLESRRFVLVRVGQCDETSAPGGAIVIVTTTTTTTVIP